MATIITEECINCAACEPECPNTAIYQGGVEYDWLDAKHAAISEELFYIVPEKCTECVGFFDYEACAAVCPVDCCVTDPDRPEPEDVLMQRAREIHPDKDIPDDAPSRFRPSETPAADAEAPPADAAAAPAAAVATGPVMMTAPTVGPSDFEVPIKCRSCDGDYAVAFRHLSPGKILRCPYCGVSFNPDRKMYLSIARRLDVYAEQLNEEIDRHNVHAEAEQILFETNVEDLRGSAEREIRRIIDEATEPPRRSIFG